MRRPLGVAFTFVLLSLAIFAQDAKQELQLGVERFKNAEYEAAIQHFQRAAELDSNLVNARLYLATAYAQLYVPGVETPYNLRLAENAITNYKKALELDPKSINALKGTAYLYLMMKRFDDARDYYGKASEIDPADAENFYSAGVIDWTVSYQLRMEKRTALRMAPSDNSFIYKSGCAEMRRQNLERVERGIRLFTKALELRPDYDDAMAYMNLMYRERADIQCGNAAANEKDLNTADNWVDLTMQTKKRKAQQAQPPQQ